MLDPGAPACEDTSVSRAWWLPVLGGLSLVGWAQIVGLGDLRHHLGAFYVWFACLFGIYLVTLWGIGRFAQRADAGRTRGFLVGVILLVALGARLLVLPSAPALSDDIYRYRWDGRVQLAGMDPYAYPPTHPALAPLRDDLWRLINFPHLRTVYPPLTQLWFRLGAWLGGSLLTIKALMVAAELLLMAALLVVLVRRGRSPLWVAAYAWHPLAVLEVAGAGHNDILGVALLWIGLAAWELRHRFAATATWVLAFLAKFGSVVLVPWWAGRREGRRWLWAFAALALLPLLCMPTLVSALLESFSAMASRGESNASLCLALSVVLGGSAAARVACVVIWAALLCWWSRVEDDPVRYVGYAMLSGALLAPVLHPWYLLWLVPCFVLWRAPAAMALTATVVLAYTVWPDYLAHGRWALPMWARLSEYAPVLGLLGWELRRCALRSSFLPATKPPLCAKS